MLNLGHGLMDNNMNVHKLRVWERPKFTHPEIITDKTLFELVFSLVYHLCSRTILVPLKCTLLNTQL